MSIPERRAMVEQPAENLSVRRQCALLNLARSGVYRNETWQPWRTLPNHRDGDENGVFDRQSRAAI
jgi:hypothetical protein